MSTHVCQATYHLQGQKELAQEAAKFPGGEDLLETFNLDVRNEESVKQGREFVESKLKQFNAKGKRVLRGRGGPKPCE